MHWLRDLVAMSGMAGMLFGVYQVYPPLTWIVGGVCVVVATIATARN